MFGSKNSSNQLHNEFMIYKKRNNMATLNVEELKEKVKDHGSDDVNAAIEVMIDSFNEQDEPYLGPFWYDPKKKEVYGQVVSLAKDLQFYSSQIWKKEIKTSSVIQKTIWEKEYFRHKDKRFSGDYTLRPRGRVFEFKDEGFKVMVGSWIKDYPEAKEEILYVFQLPKDNTEFVIDEHWDIGHGWSQEF